MKRSDLPEVMEVDAASLPRPWSAAVWREELRSPYSRYLVLEEEGGISGQIGVKRVADELHIMTLAVRPERRRRGHARRLVEAALSAHPDIRRVYLEVRPGNAAARALYESLGFFVTGTRPGYYGDEDALLMTLDLRASGKPSDAGPAPPSGAESPPGSRRA
ncbi:MAG: ribosomal protein S18-alanine N-acetyltransferase [Actinomycetota bacterium]|nr:ribosomal protein S18-alanine N-acetyltransferase [Actinomycetota bacterium]